MITDAPHGRARIIDVTPGRISSALDEGVIPIVAGQQTITAADPVPDDLRQPLNAINRPG